MRWSKETIGHLFLQLPFFSAFWTYVQKFLLMEHSTSWASKFFSIQSGHSIWDLKKAILSAWIKNLRKWIWWYFYFTKLQVYFIWNTWPYIKTDCTNIQLFLHYNLFRFWRQCFVCMGFFCGKWTPAAFGFLPSKETASYRNFFRILKSLHTKHRGGILHGDLEKWGLKLEVYTYFELGIHGLISLDTFINKIISK